MNTYSMELSKGAAMSVNPDAGRSRHRWAMAYGFQYESHGETHRSVTLSVRSGSLTIDCDYTTYQYATLGMTPDEARGLAARLLDAADDADEQRYTLTAKGEAALV